MCVAAAVISTALLIIRFAGNFPEVHNPFPVNLEDKEQYRSPIAGIAVDQYLPSYILPANSLDQAWRNPKQDGPNMTPRIIFPSGQPQAPVPEDSFAFSITYLPYIIRAIET